MNKSELTDKFREFGDYVRSTTELTVAKNLFIAGLAAPALNGETRAEAEADMKTIQSITRKWEAYLNNLGRQKIDNVHEPMIILACPLCESKNDVAVEVVDDEYFRFVRCNNCGASGPTYFKREFAIKGWNSLVKNNNDA